MVLESLCQWFYFDHRWEFFQIKPLSQQRTLLERFRFSSEYEL